MTKRAPASRAHWQLDGTTLSVRIPMRFHRRGGRKVVIAPDGCDALGAPAVPLPNGTLLRALGRAHRWKRMLENGTHGTISDLAAAEKINVSYLSRMLQLTLLVPEIVEQILDGTLSRSISLSDLLGGLPVHWHKQRDCLRN